MKSDALLNKLKEFAEEFKINSKGPLCVVLVVTRNAKDLKTPIKAEDFLTEQGGQVAGLGRQAVQKILEDHGIQRVLAEEGGRTSRGSIRRMRGYVDFLNELDEDDLLDFSAIESWWIERVREFFAAKPFKLKLDASKSLRRIISDLLDAAFKRQEECPGTMAAGAVMEHLVGAKLEIALQDVKIDHKGFSVADAPGSRKGDFLVCDSAIHVTTAPTEALIRKCLTNIEEGFRPIIITTESGAGGAKALAKNEDIEDRIDILEIEQFVATNVYEWSRFATDRRTVSINELAKAYNNIVESCETDPSLKISIS